MAATVQCSACVKDDRWVSHGMLDQGGNGKPHSQATRPQSYAAPVWFTKNQQSERIRQPIGSEERDTKIIVELVAQS